MRNLRGFTLIELLIVVAIIAILAAIAVPNFLEAQTRARVARVQADFKSLGTAIEAFQIDYNMYPKCNVDTRSMNPVPGTGRLTFANLANSGIGGSSNRKFSLTTPIAHIAAVPYDPFAEVTGCLPGYGNADERGWILWSTGPDGKNVFDTKFKSYTYTTKSNWKTNTIYAPNFKSTKSHPQIDLIRLTYDPTNGSGSDGEIYTSTP